MSFTRTFVAVDTSGVVQERATSLIERFKPSGAKVNWVATTNMHVTLKFLGDLRDTQVAAVCRVVEQAAAAVEPFEFLCAGVGAFPNLQRPRTVWVGVTHGKEPFAALHARVDAELTRIGFPGDRRGFQPHVTIGRVRSGGPTQQALSELIQKHRDFLAGSVFADEVVVYASQLRSGGPRYDVLARAALVGRG